MSWLRLNLGDCIKFIDVGMIVGMENSRNLCVNWW
jgi:hypothetical protein